MKNHLDLILKNQRRRAKRKAEERRARKDKTRNLERGTANEGGEILRIL